ncbi:hypothetical protein B9Z55_028600 [Caenorhabditis nigoni]|uniref:Uncharacterized protein n=1 Tax=Caenorhabditis nigoni TaxID=1611254 RepID=A0A2G5SB59_9PELO|nr:hypothetical protein B9Z55_028600 [Caenorhabditis nigoni]
MGYKLFLGILIVLAIGSALWVLIGCHESGNLQEAASNTTWTSETVNAENGCTTNEFILVFIVLSVLVLMCCNLSNQLPARLARHIFGYLRKAQTPENSPFLEEDKENGDNVEEIATVRNESDRVEVVCLPMAKKTKKSKSKENSKIRTSETIGHEMFVFNKAFNGEDHEDSSSEIGNSTVEQSAASSTNMAGKVGEQLMYNP